MIRIAVPAEFETAERRVALTPGAVGALIETGHSVVVEAGAGTRAGFADQAYLDVGARVANLEEVVGDDGLVAMINGPTQDRGGQALWSMLGEQHTVIGLIDPLWRPDNAAKLAATGATIFSLELIPRTTRAQSMDVLSSMATVVGYEAALLAARRSPKMFPLMMTAAGTIPAAKVLVLGAGVAGLQAIATSRRLGAIVEGYDIRPAAMEQIRSLGARTVDIAPRNVSSEDGGGYARAQTDDAQRVQSELLTPAVAGAEAVITTAAVPGSASPELITTTMVEAMASGSLIVDLAAERGGNCKLTVADEEVDHDGVVTLGPTDLASRAAATSSRLFSTNLSSFIAHLAPEGDLVIDDDEITTETLVSRSGEVVNPRVLDRLGLTHSSPDRPAADPVGDLEDESS